MKARGTRSVAAIVLAAGRSSRMGPYNKLLESIDGKPIVVRAVETAIASRADPVIVVTGFEAERIAEALRGVPVTLVHNPDFEEGLSTSLRTGLRALPSTAEGTLVLLGDMPFLEVGDLDALLIAFVTKDRRAICVPVYHGKRGNPVLWGAFHFAEMMALSGDVGAKQLMARHAEHVVEVPVESEGIFADIDTASDLAQFRMKL